MLDQLCDHCTIFPTAADPIGVWTVSFQCADHPLNHLRIVALVGPFSTPAHKQSTDIRIIQSRKPEGPPPSHRRSKCVLIVRFPLRYPPRKSRFLCISSPSATPSHQESSTTRGLPFDLAWFWWVRLCRPRFTLRSGSNSSLKMNIPDKL